ncbi:preferentially expressed antigen in melanoma-like protein 7 isoform X2 [Meriones unguiculatus]|uniref:preferentially expressed antigen in melanoma-like protein 7 isoform X2 n=1 Tax=Meriones unguiculatus TaxID=10047 RepID=UPI00293ED264|nr:preferentially expressed antigen in melanoma-like protein 7 isoform X2 [Meriones unguiculatus]
MSAQTPPTLLKLAMQALLRDETLDMSALDKLPMVFFPALFKEALTGRHTTTVKAMVAAWPFPCLPVGALMKTPDLETFQAVLAGVDTWLQRKFHPRCLTTPLETLSITYCHISQADLNYFSECSKLSELKHLDMKGVPLKALDLMPLRVLLENVADTLLSLDLKACRMKDSHLTVLIPALSKCSQLCKVNFYCNEFSMPILRDLLQHTANLSKMKVEKYPAPIECYDEFGYVSIERFVQLCVEQIDRLRAIRQPKCISFATHMCPRCGERCVYGMGSRLCLCQRRQR